MNAKHLVTSLSQQLDTSCMEFPDGFEETQQQQVSIGFVYFDSTPLNTYKTDRGSDAERSKCKIQNSKERIEKSFELCIVVEVF